MRQRDKDLAIGQLMNLLQDKNMSKYQIIRFIKELEKLKQKYTNKETRKLTITRLREKGINLEDYPVSTALQVLRPRPPTKYTNKKNNYKGGKRKTQKNLKNIQGSNKKRGSPLFFLRILIHIPYSSCIPLMEPFNH
jgi:hypothetical protein